MQDSRWLREPQLLDNILVQDSAKSPPFTQLFVVDAKYAKHLRVFGEIFVVADTDNKVGRTKIDPRGKISLFVGYSTQHAGDVYRLLNPKTSRVIHSRDVKWTGKMWAEFYKIKMIDRASGYVDPDEDFQLEKEEDQDDEEEESEPEENESEIVQGGQSQAEEPTETPVGVANDEPVASRTRSQTTASEPIAARTRQALGSSPLYPHWYYLDLVTFSVQEKTVSVVTEFIHHNQPMSISSSADSFERADVHEYPVSRSGG